MRTDPITKEVFEPQTNEHFFKSKQSFDAFIDSLDPIDELKEVKREINWGPIVRNCTHCENSFIATHPATMYCENCREHDEKAEMRQMEEDEQVERENGIIRR